MKPIFRAACEMRSRSSNAAFSVNVQTTISAGFARSRRSRFSVRRTSEKVFPEPGPAMTSSGPSWCAMIWRFASSRPGYARRSAGAIVGVAVGADVDVLVQAGQVRRPTRGAVRAKTARHPHLLSGRVSRAISRPQAHFRARQGAHAQEPRPRPDLAFAPLQVLHRWRSPRPAAPMTSAE